MGHRGRASFCGNSLARRTPPRPAVGAAVAWRTQRARRGGSRSWEVEPAASGLEKWGALRGSLVFQRQWGEVPEGSPSREGEARRLTTPPGRWRWGRPSASGSADPGSRRLPLRRAAVADGSPGHSGTARPACHTPAPGSAETPPARAVVVSHSCHLSPSRHEPHCTETPALHPNSTARRYRLPSRFDRWGT